MSTERRKQCIAVIGAGSAGITAVKSCLENGLEAVCFEKDSQLGGLWWYREETAANTGCVMKCTISNTSKEMTAYSDFIPSLDLPIYLPHEKMLSYLKAYADHFDVTPRIRFNHTVINIVPADDYDWTGRWVVQVQHEDGVPYLVEFDGVMICTGHHSFPRVPSFPGQETFRGRLLHVREYKHGQSFQDRNVVVVGLGNSAVDVAVELSQIAKKVYLSTRRGSWVIAPSIKGEPTDSVLVTRINSFIIRNAPLSLLSSITEKRLNDWFDHEAYGLKPNHRFFSQQATVNAFIPNLILSGTVTIKPNIDRFTEEGVVFDGERDRVYPVDAVIFATGYDVQVPFISDELFVQKEGRPILYKFMFPPQMKHPTLCFIGFLQTVGSLQQVFEIQSRYFVQVFLRNLKLPSERQQLRDISVAHGKMKRRFIDSPRHAILTDKLPYMDEIATLIGVKPNFFAMMFTDPKLFYHCVFGPFLAYQFRLVGPNAWPGARAAILEYRDRLFAPLVTSRNQKAQVVKRKCLENIVSGLKIVSFVAFFSLLFCGRKVLTFETW